MRKTRLKGGSLSGTYLCQPDHGEPFVRKEVSLVHNREYGFQRWYSQLKRMQRYEVLFPGVFPALRGYGLDDTQADMAYFDMAYIPDAVTCQQFLLDTVDPARIAQMWAALQAVMARMHATRVVSGPAPMPLYIYEEIETKVRACLEDAQFAAFYRLPTLKFNGVEVQGLGSVLPVYKALAARCYRATDETFTHGNLTLENILYQPVQDRIVFIDPYEENIIDSVLAEYSQVLQSCNSKYELYNAADARVEGNAVWCDIPPAPGLETFNRLFQDFLRVQCDDDALTTVRLLEISQFMRMLPFKMAIAPEKMYFFYALASYLFHQLREDRARQGRS